jgi:hypothetical protein
MKIYTKVVIDIDSGEVIEEQAFEYQGPVARCWESGGDNSPESEGEAGASSSSGSSGGDNGGSSWDSAYSGANPDSTAYGGVGTPSERASIESMGGDQHSPGAMDSGSQTDKQKAATSSNLSDETKAMLHSPSAQDYQDYYASKLGVMGTPGADWGAFTNALNSIGSYWGKTAQWGINDMIGKVAGIPDKIAAALGFGQTPDTVETAFGPMSRDMGVATLDIPEVSAAQLGTSLAGIAQTRLPTSDEINMVAGMMADRGLLGPVDMAGMQVADMAGQMVGQAATPAAAIGAMKAGIDITNPAVQKAMGMGIDSFGNMIGRAINAQTIAERAGGTGIAAGQVGTISREAQAMGEAAGRGGSERSLGDLSGRGKLDAFNALLNQGGFQQTQSRGPTNAGGGPSPAKQTGQPQPQQQDERAPAPMAKRQQGSRLGLSDYMTLTNNLGVGPESVELRNRMLGGA